MCYATVRLSDRAYRRPPPPLPPPAGGGGVDGTGGFQAFLILTGTGLSHTASFLSVRSLVIRLGVDSRLG